jgi:AcrR family transcriptional regulator
MSQRMKRKKEERRNDILDVSEKIIAKKGIYGMTMNEVAKEADVATGTLYVYFKNKNSLCAAVNARINKQMRLLMEDKLSNCNNACEKISASAATVIDFREKYPEKWNAFRELLLIHFQDTIDENIQELISEDKKMLDLLTDNYQQGIEECNIRSEIDLLPATIFMRMALFTAMEPLPYAQRMLKNESISTEKFVKVAKDLMRYAVSSQSSEKR